MKRVLAFDFGASSGRAILAEYDNRRLTYREVHRFENNPREKDGYFRWDFQNLMDNVRVGLKKAGPIDSLSFDTWGVDFGLLKHCIQLEYARQESLRIRFTKRDENGKVFQYFASYDPRDIRLVDFRGKSQEEINTTLEEWSSQPLSRWIRR